MDSLLQEECAAPIWFLYQARSDSNNGLLTWDKLANVVKYHPNLDDTNLSSLI